MRAPPGSSTSDARPLRSVRPATSLVESMMISSGPDGPDQLPSRPLVARAVSWWSGRLLRTRNRRRSNVSIVAVPLNTRRALSVEVVPESAKNASSPSSASSSASESPRAAALSEPLTRPRSAVGVIALPTDATLAESMINCASSQVVEVSFATRPAPRKWDTGSAPSVRITSAPSNRKSSIGPVRVTRPCR